ncbi:FAD binding domain-containing protein [Rhodococcus fascians]|uniref:6-hydroxypseudooxynicotine dehydrogenase complex subunit alpha n=1 Tax=Rhodococcoides fascians TaxID=1828 RepID=A0A143QSA4_RHOFA|nr:FAD binding domain-containing protein [Rhodococcus fascians]AMY26035.1 6-hydroxypseudooxynicotine dehydrogenase complex subunit alpha [Rhodococcus fascians]MBY4040224.1 FAD binding domain-containing protein [Rhodococcus fascians]MBY4140206.1 FAD binding domain-containing protein [Rhodococcus fascians]MBY4218871.1 FAD binding domain-containing protein [Rhodococcus fascians]MBY4223865.1 FAD binding domain-containing protein [Rhodococcus fascians]
MKPSPLKYHRPRSIEEACRILAEVDGKVLAGGQSLIPMLSMRLAAPGNLIDITGIDGLDDITGSTDSGVTFAALATHASLASNRAAARTQPLLGRALQLVAHATIRNRGTTVGSIVHADPSAEMPAVIRLLDGSVTVQSVRGRREIAAKDLFLGPLESSLDTDEIAIAATVPAARAGEGTAIDEVARRHGDYALVGVAARVTVADNAVRTAHVTYVSAGEFGEVVDYTDVIGGAAVSDARDPKWNALSEDARLRVETESDIHATAAYRSQLVAALTARVVMAAAVDGASSMSTHPQHADSGVNH